MKGIQDIRSAKRQIENQIIALYKLSNSLLDDGTNELSSSVRVVLYDVKKGCIELLEKLNEF